MSNLVSIIIPTFNSEKFITEAIESVQNQTFTNWEIILVDDASTDSTVEIINKIINTDSRIHLHQLEANSGTGVARNKALSYAKGRYIAFLDADDLWLPEKLQKQLDFLVQKRIPFTFSSYDCIDEEGNSLLKRVNPPQNMTYRQLFFCNYVGNLTGIYDTQFFGKIPISSIRKRQDWMHWLTILKKIKKAQALPESLAYYRVRQNSISASKFDLVKHNFAVYKQYHGFNWFLALGCMSVFLFTQLVIKPFYIKQLPIQK
ncbi:glycosyltransferase family 2 protein [Flavobacterium sp. NG2]|uniref:glycosyltransferase family 2 protein n=1 Tax=Flavobacterium sp. NG2 TaxID=3097547 RepID=UPI002A80704B|nr:glycosyltransferase family 2 protein [Flavobacterium sp. NG2]WPR72273.1 glycosyltransferase family 2 protein [Flavobacterium sp. NG2]